MFLLLAGCTGRVRREDGTTPLPAVPATPVAEAPAPTAIETGTLDAGSRLLREPVLGAVAVETPPIGGEPEAPPAARTPVTAAPPSRVPAGSAVLPRHVPPPPPPPAWPADPHRLG
jgi:hypothetical protein